MLKDKKPAVQKPRNSLKAMLAIFLAAEIFFIHKLFTYKEPELMPYHDEFVELVSRYCTPDQFYHPTLETVKFYNAEPIGELARCESFNYGYAIKFDRASWAAMTEADRKQTMAHELVHCMFNQDHVADPRNFMAPYLNEMDEGTLMVQVDAYLREKCGELKQ